MKTLLLGLGALLLTQAHARPCRVTSSCIKKISSCKLWEDEPAYSSDTGELTRSAYFTWERKDVMKCLRDTPTVEISNEAVPGEVGEVYVKELRIPDSLEEVPEKYIREVNRVSLKNCESQKEFLTSLYSFCE